MHEMNVQVMKSNDIMTYESSVIMILNFLCIFNINNKPFTKFMDSMLHPLQDG